MKKVIAIVAILLVALIGLSSYNTNENTKSKNGDDTLLAALKTSTKGVPVTNGGTGVGTGTGSAGNGTVRPD